MRVGYSKIGRSWQLSSNKGSIGNGDVDVRNALHRLTNAHPEIEWLLVGRNSGDNPQECGYPSNVTNPWEVGKGLREGVAANLKLNSAPMSLEDIDRTHDYLHNCTVDMFTKEVDTHLLWAGQHSGSNRKLPMTKGEGFTKPQDSFVYYASYVNAGLNAWKSLDPANNQETWMLPDVRNYLKARDLAWPIMKPVLAQYTRHHERHMYRFGDPKRPAEYGMAPPAYINDKTHAGCWTAKEQYVYSGVEFTAVDAPEKSRPIFENRPGHGQRFPFGILVNETRWLGKKVDGQRLSGALSRVTVLKEYVTENFPGCEIFGQWSDDSKADLGRPDIRPCPTEFLPQTMQRWRCMLTTPASGSGWATAKPWEAFAFGTVCFAHPKYDDQNWIYGNDMPKELREWLRVPSADSLRKRVEYLDANPATWEWIVSEQRKYFEQKYDEYQGGILAVERSLGLK